ncbi:hypothetical protein JHK82_033669 [Glycine max]|uniref:Uncharacterized protein n=1 Tax=Glycine soja TaxID=3848 RepID=A0A445HPG4_GLYSO|nr:hypothetical protein JHK87_033613 [Glycine soja]KAG4980429.1 hypothetical protein JHK85_034387 [Glycine max]KAG5119249.1 hypothetical protein JHK82_033669 [Glycine max]KAG5140241.1 hypothetical protein JHK84_034009 [Glycine max]KAH1142982.1 hypothetical protein GYH30_033620 [Glycine max]
MYKNLRNGICCLISILWEDKPPPAERFRVRSQIQIKPKILCQGFREQVCFGNSWLTQGPFLVFATRFGELMVT